MQSLINNYTFPSANAEPYMHMSILVHPASDYKGLTKHSPGLSENKQTWAGSAKQMFSQSHISGTQKKTDLYAPCADSENQDQTHDIHHPAGDGIENRSE